MSNDRQRAQELYIDSKGSIALVDIAEKLNRPASTIRGWKSKDNWDKFLDGTLQNETKRSGAKVKVDRKTERVKKEVKRIVENDDLTPQQKNFCLFYIEDFNGTKAYQRAFDVPYNTASVGASRLLRNDKVRREIKRLTETVIEEQLIPSQLLSRRLLEQLVKIAFADITDYIYFGKKEIEIEPGSEIYVEVNYVDFMESHLVDGEVISELSQGKEGVKLKLHDKLKAIDTLLRYYVMLDEKDVGMEREMFKAKLEKEKAQTEKLQAEIDKMVSQDEDAKEGNKTNISKIDSILAQLRK